MGSEESLLERLVNSAAKIGAGLVLAGALWACGNTAGAAEGANVVEGNYISWSIEKRYKLKGAGWNTDRVSDRKKFYVGDTEYIGKKEKWFLINGENYQIIITDDDDVLFGRRQRNHTDKKKHVELLEAVVVADKKIIEKGSKRFTIYKDGSYDLERKVAVRQAGKRTTYRFEPVRQEAPPAEPAPSVAAPEPILRTTPKPVPEPKLVDKDAPGYIRMPINERSLKNAKAYPTKWLYGIEIYDENKTLLYKQGSIREPANIDKENEDYKPGKYHLHFVYRVNEWGYWRNNDPFIMEVKPGESKLLGYIISWGKKPKEFVKLSIGGKIIKLDKIKSYD